MAEVNDQGEQVKESPKQMAEQHGNTHPTNDREKRTCKFLKELYDACHEEPVRNKELKAQDIAKRNGINATNLSVLSKHNYLAVERSQHGTTQWMVGEPNLAMARKVIELCRKSAGDMNKKWLAKKNMAKNAAKDTSVSPHVTTIVVKGDLTDEAFRFKMLLAYLHEKLKDLTLTHKALNLDKILEKYHLEIIHLDVLVINEIIIRDVKGDVIEYTWGDDKINPTDDNFDELVLKLVRDVINCKWVLENKLAIHTPAPTSLSKELKVIITLKERGEDFTHISKIVELPIPQIKDMYFDHILSSK